MMNRLYLPVGESGNFTPLGLQLERPSEDASVRCCALVCRCRTEWSGAPTEEGCLCYTPFLLYPQSSLYSAAHAHMGGAQDWSCEDSETVSKRTVQITRALGEYLKSTQEYRPTTVLGVYQFGIRFSTSQTC